VSVLGQEALGRADGQGWRPDYGDRVAWLAADERMRLVNSVADVLSAQLLADGAGVEITCEELRDALDAAGAVLVRSFNGVGRPAPGVRLVDGAACYSAGWL